MAIEKMREDGGDPLILDAGDMFFSTTNINDNNLKSEKHRCETMLEVYEKIGCDGLNIGKYELLAGLGYLKDMKEKYTNIDFISANIRDKNTNDLIFSPYKIIQKENLNIGVIGLTNMAPDSMKSIVVDDYVKAGNDYIKKIKNKVDIIVMLINAERNIQSSLTNNFKNADFIFTSGSTHKTSPSTPQASGGPFLYANGKQGKYLTVIDLELKNSSLPIIDVSTHEQTIRKINNRLKRLRKKDHPQIAQYEIELEAKEIAADIRFRAGHGFDSEKRNQINILKQKIELLKQDKSLEAIYAGQENILNMIKRYRQDIEKSESVLQSANNKMKYSSIALNKMVKDDPEILAMVDSAIETCSTLNLSEPKKPKKPKNSKRQKPKKKSKRLKLPKPPKVNTRP